MKIMYLMAKPEHLRSYATVIRESEKRGFGNIIITPSGDQNLCLDIENVFYYKEKRDIIKLIIKHNPDIWIQCGFSSRYKDILNQCGVKMVCVAHAITVKNKFTLDMFKLHNANCFDAIFIHENKEAENLINYCGAKKDKIFLNCLPQLDLLKEGENLFEEFNMQNKTFNKILDHRAKGKKIVFFAMARDDINFYSNNEHKILKYLADNVNDNYIFLLKEKVSGYIKKLCDSNNIILDNKFIIVDSNDMWYRFKDVIDIGILSDPSTMESEFSLMNKNILVVSENYIDYFGASKSGASIPIDNLNNLIENIDAYTASAPLKKFLLYDFQASKRIVDVLEELIDDIKLVQHKDNKHEKSHKMWWKNKAITSINKNWSSDITKRDKYLIEKLKEIKFESIYEIGYFSGRGLYYIKEQFPDIRVSGTDICIEAKEYAEKKLGDVFLETGGIEDIDVSKKYDVVFTSGTLTSIFNIDKALEVCANKANKFIIHIESNGDDYIVNGPRQFYPETESPRFLWLPNICKRYSDMGLKVTCEKLPDNIYSRFCGNFIKVTL